MADYKKIPAGLRITPLEGKAAFLPKWQDGEGSSSDPAQIEKWAAKYPSCNWGVVRTDECWMLDVDNLPWFMDSLPKDLVPKTFTVRTGSGKLHFYFAGKMPEGLSSVANPAFKSKEETPSEPAKQFEFPAQCVAPGSIHPGTKKEYTAANGVAPVPADPKLVDWLRSMCRAKSSDPSLRMRPLALGWNPRVELEKAGLKFDERAQDDGVVRFDYHAKHGKCLVRGSSHAEGSETPNPRQCSFFWRPSDGQFWHWCFSASCQVPGQTAKAMEELGLDLSAAQRKKGLPPPLVVLSDEEFSRYAFKKREALMVTRNGHPVFHTASINEIHAWRGTGKTNFGFGMADALSNGGAFLAWKATRRFKVLYVEGELPGEELQQRKKGLVSANDHLFWITPEAQPGAYIPLFSTPEGRDLIEEACVAHGIEVLELDSISSLANIATNKEEEWLDLNAWFLRLRNKYGLAKFFMQHDGKNGSQRGHSKVEDVVDKAVRLYWNGDPAIKNLRCSLKFDKARQPVREDDHLDIELMDGPDGRSVWTWTPHRKDKPSEETEQQDPRVPKIHEGLLAGKDKRTLAKEMSFEGKTPERSIDRILEKEAERLKKLEEARQRAEASAANEDLF